MGTEARWGHRQAKNENIRKFDSFKSQIQKFLVRIRTIIFLGFVCPCPLSHLGSRLSLPYLALTQDNSTGTGTRNGYGNANN